MSMEIDNRHGVYGYAQGGYAKNSEKTDTHDKQCVERSKQSNNSVTADDEGVKLELSKQGVSASENNASTKEQNETLSFRNVGELMNYLRDNYNIVRRGMASISSGFLSDCINDEDKLKKLFDNLAAADEMDADNRENAKGYQGMKVKIDNDGKMETESYGGWVGFNEGKRARQLAAAKSKSDIQSLMTILQNDLAECESGKSKGMCDDETISKVKNMIAKAKQRMGELSGKKEEDNPADRQAFLMAGLM